MSRMIFCQKLQKELPGFDTPPYPGPLGERVMAEISAQAWDEWIKHQTILLNEYRLSPLDPDTPAFLEKEMNTFLFTDESKAVPGHVPLQKTEEDGPK